VWFSRPPYKYNVSSIASSITTLALMLPNIPFTNINAELLLNAKDEDLANKEFLLIKL
jgi:hypothetical protein